jgi:protein-tyrosine phosphatase
LRESYLAIARLSGPSIVSMLEILSAADQLPGVIFCAAGKDRTGVASALLLGALGVPDEIVVADYARSNTLDPRSLGDDYADYFAHLPADYLGAEETTMQWVLDRLREEHGSIRDFVGDSGFARFDALEGELLD